ncbi:hypothetical protein [Kitasatospora sp. NBC_01266]|uniref:hypothetical protein n=1 Tax=Kitasatospora sp. NBC_01266 TaxID=2903572 RepID=UPI002E352B2B|nr:hypothetical protein [Kitasatospora sp. NBC_01266]
MPSKRQDLFDSVIATLTAADLPLALDGDGCEGAVVRAECHGVTVSWQSGRSGPSGRPLPLHKHGRRDGAGHRMSGSSAVRSRNFQSALHLAATLAAAGHQSDHLGDRVLVSD